MSLIHAARRVAAQADQNPLDLPDDRYPADDFDHVHVQAGLAGRTDARDALPLAALLDALGPAGLRRVQGRDGLALVIEVPAPDWGTRVEMALRDLGAFAEITVKSGASRTQDKPSEGNGVVSAVLSRGGRIAGISPAPARYLPATLTQAADLVVRIGPPSNRVIAGVIKAVTGKRARRLPAAVAAGLTFDAITAAIRLGTSPASCIARLQASARALSGGDALGEDVPDLGSLAGYGPAMSLGPRPRARPRRMESRATGVLSNLEELHALLGAGPGQVKPHPQHRQGGKGAARLGERRRTLHLRLPDILTECSRHGTRRSRKPRPSHRASCSSTRSTVFLTGPRWIIVEGIGGPRS